MNDYLGRLALRARGELDVPRPVTKPVFATEFPAAKKDREETPRLGRQPAPSQPSAHPSVSARSGPIVKPGGQLASPLQEISTEIEAKPERPPERGNPQERPDHAQLDQDSAAEEVTTITKDRETGTKPSARVKAKEAGERNRDEQGIDLVPVERPPAPANERIIARSFVEPLAAGGRQEETGSADRGQTIHITIGRVEVRAVMPAAPKAAPLPPQPKPLSLEEYMKAREERRKG